MPRYEVSCKLEYLYVVDASTEDIAKDLAEQRMMEELAEDVRTQGYLSIESNTSSTDAEDNDVDIRETDQDM